MTDNPWQGLARHQGGRRKEQATAGALGSQVLTLPYGTAGPWHYLHIAANAHTNPDGVGGGFVPAEVAGPGTALGCRSPSTRDRGWMDLAA